MNSARRVFAVALLALFALVSCGPIVVKCPDGTPAVLPRDCAAGFEVFAAQKTAKFKVDFEYVKVRVGADAELGAKIAQLGDTMNQLTIMYRTAWLGACNAWRGAPCDPVTRAKVLEIEQNLVALMSKAADELAKARGMCDAAGGVPADPAKKLEIKACLEKAKASLSPAIM
jgi:hypothetical protein